MQRIVFPKLVSAVLLTALLAGLILILPSRSASAVTSTPPPDYCIVSGISSPADANGVYLLNGTSSSGNPKYQQAGYNLIYQGFGSAPAHWMIASGLEYFSNGLFTFAPPTSGWTAVNGTGSPSLSCGAGAPPTPASPAPTKSPLSYLNGDGLRVNLSCQNTLSIALASSGGNLAVLGCPVSGLGSNNGLSQADLPGPLPGGTFVSGMTLSVLGGGTPLTVLPSPWIVAFKMPDGVSADHLAILFWDPGSSAWIELPALGNAATFQVLDLGGGRKVLVGAHQYTRTHFSATINFTGSFVLVQK